MESKTKNRQSNEVLLQMTRQAFGAECVSEGEFAVKELKEGYFNAAYEIILRNGRKVVIKIAPPRKVDIMSYEINIMKTEVDMLGLVKASTDVPVPEIYYYDGSRQIIDSDYYFMEYIKGIPLNIVKKDLSIEVQDEIERQLGSYNRRINDISGDYFGYPGSEELQDKSWQVVFVKMVEAVLQDGERQDVDLGISYEDVRLTLHRMSPFLKEVIKPQLIHWDLWYGNVFVEKGRITGIIDFERALWGDPLMEHCFRGIVESAQSISYLEGYEWTSFTEAERKRRILYNIYLYLIMVVECAYRDYDNDWQYNWAKGKLLEMIQLVQ